MAGVLGAAGRPRASWWSYGCLARHGPVGKAMAPMGQWAAAHCIAHWPEHLTRARTQPLSRALSLTPLLVVTRRGDLDEAEIQKKAGGGK